MPAVGRDECSEPVVDPGQGVRIVFLDLGGTQLELIEPAGPDSPVAKRVLKSPGLFHLCFEVDDLEETLRRLEAAEEATVIKPPQPAPAIDDRRVAFVVTTGTILSNSWNAKEENMMTTRHRTWRSGGTAFTGSIPGCFGRWSWQSLPDRTADDRGEPHDRRAV